MSGSWTDKPSSGKIDFLDMLKVHELRRVCYIKSTWDIHVLHAHEVQIR